MVKSEKEKITPPVITDQAPCCVIYRAIIMVRLWRSDESRPCRRAVLVDGEVDCKDDGGYTLGNTHLKAAMLKLGS